MVYVAGWNQPGYLPDTDEPLPTFDTMDEAVRYLVTEVDRFWDEDYTAVETSGERLELDGKWLPVHTALHVAIPLYDNGDSTFSESTGDGSLVFFIQPLEIKAAGIIRNGEVRIIPPNE